MMSESLAGEQAVPVLLGSTFPLSLVRRPVQIEPRGVEELRGLLQTHPCASFWGHANTLAAAAALLGVDVRPESERPALLLSSDNLPCLNGRAYDACWVLSPEYVPGYRPQVGEEVPLDKIQGWQALRITWTDL